MVGVDFKKLNTFFPGGLKESFKKVLPIFFISRISIFLLGALSNLVIMGGKFKPKSPSFILSFFRWDSDWYMSIVKMGYSVHPGAMSNVVFFPLYPYTVKAICFFTGNPIIIGFLLSNVAILFASVFLYELLKQDYGSQIAEKTVFYMFIFPTSFYFSIFYTESFFCFFLLLRSILREKEDGFMPDCLDFFFL